MNLKSYLENNPKKYLIFDFDETVMWAKIDWSNLQKQRYEYLKRIAPKIVEKDKEKASTKRVDQTIQHYGDELYQEVMNNETRLELTNLTGFEPNPEVIEFINANKNDYKFYIWSSNTLDLIEKGLKEYKLFNIFDHLVSKDRVKQVKPKSYGFFEIYNEGTTLKDYLMIGNNLYSDKGAAESVGIDFFHITYFDK